MASTRQIKSRIRSVKSNKQITKAMEMVAASKLRKAQESAQRSQQYTRTALEILDSLVVLTDVQSHILFTVRAVKSRVTIIVTSDRGLAGSYNANALKLLTLKLIDDDKKGIRSKVIAVGKKGARFVSKLKNVDVIGSYNAGDEVTQDDVRPIMATVVDMFKRGEVDAVEVITTEFVNSFKQTAHTLRLLPAGYGMVVQEGDAEEAKMLSQAKFEPSMSEVLDYIVEQMVEAELYQALLDGMASEHAMRRVAMKNASDNASDIIDDLTLEMNKVRQTSITQELSEISAGVEAMG